jgi:hypothetical protein
MLRKLHDERLVPWLHHIPVNLEMRKLSKIATWLTSTYEGRRVARAVAEQGLQRALKALKEEDRAVCVYQLLLELAKIQKPDRPALTIPPKLS